MKALCLIKIKLSQSFSGLYFSDGVGGAIIYVVAWVGCDLKVLLLLRDSFYVRSLV